MITFLFIIAKLIQSSFACTARGSGTPIANGCNLKTNILNSGKLSQTFDYSTNGNLTPIYYSSDNCENAYVIFSWSFPTMNPEIDDLYQLHYCIEGPDR